MGQILIPTKKKGGGAGKGLASLKGGGGGLKKCWGSLNTGA